MNMFVDREGTLVMVGTDYIIIQETETDDYLLCDIYSIKVYKVLLLMVFPVLSLHYNM